jgi:hypothetical protein
VQDEAFERAATNIGISPDVALQRKMQHCGGRSKDGKEDKDLRRYSRAYLALALMDLIEEASGLPALRLLPVLLC